MSPVSLARFLALVALLALGACSSETVTVAIPTAGVRAPELSADTVRVDEPELRNTARVGYPVLGRAAAAERVNRQIRGVATRAAAEFRRTEPPGPDAGMSEVSDVQGHFEVDLLTDGLFSFNQAIWAYTGGAHGNTFFFPQTYNLRTGATVGLADVIAPSDAAWQALADGARAELFRQARGRFGLDPGDDPAEWLFADTIEPDRETFEAIWTIAPDSLVIHFAPYAVAPYAAGSWRVPVAYADLAGHLGPVARDLAGR